MHPGTPTSHPRKSTHSSRCSDGADPGRPAVRLHRPDGDPSCRGSIGRHLPTIIATVALAAGITATGLGAVASADDTPTTTPAAPGVAASAPSSPEHSRGLSVDLRQDYHGRQAGRLNPTDGDLERARAAEIDRLRKAVVRRALNQVGDDYAAGAEGPDAFDCSGFTLYAWKAAGVTLTHYSRAQYQQTMRISVKEAVPGDLAFYLENGAHHVALYIGNGKIVHASDYGIGVVIGDLRGNAWADAHFTGMGRVKVKNA